MRNSLVLFCCLCFACDCGSNYTPKPRAYFKIHLPEKNYQEYQSDCHYIFEYPNYATIHELNDCMLDINFPDLSAKLHISYFKLTQQRSLALHIDESNKLAYKHIAKANAIKESDILNRRSNLYGVLYDYNGSTATSIQFFLTDSANHFFRGALYFNTEVNDSIIPINHFLKQDVVHLIESFSWRDT